MQGIPLVRPRRRDEAPDGPPPGFGEAPPPLPTAAPPRPVEAAPAPTPRQERQEAREMVQRAREARQERRTVRKGYAPLARKGGVRRESTWLYVALVAVWWPAMWKLGMPLDWAGAGLAAAAAALLGLQVGDTVRPSGAAKAEEA